MPTDNCNEFTATISLANGGIISNDTFNRYVLGNWNSKLCNS